jgi:hypothetical protein
MPQSEARAWWADVEHVRETIERRRAAERHLKLVPDPPQRSSAAREQVARGPVPRAHRSGAAARRARSPREASHHAEGRAARQAAGRRPAAPAPRQPARRRTVEITGRTVPAPPVAEIGQPPVASFGARGAARRPLLSPADRLVHRPDRIALWAVVLGFVLTVVAATSS